MALFNASVVGKRPRSQVNTRSATSGDSNRSASDFFSQLEGLHVQAFQHFSRPQDIQQNSLAAPAAEMVAVVEEIVLIAPGEQFLPASHKPTGVEEDEIALYSEILGPLRFLDSQWQYQLIGLGLWLSFLLGAVYQFNGGAILWRHARTMSELTPTLRSQE